jgi:hypothetical protein
LRDLLKIVGEDDSIELELELVLLVSKGYPALVKKLTLIIGTVHKRTRRNDLDGWPPAAADAEIRCLGVDQTGNKVEKQVVNLVHFFLSECEQVRLILPDQVESPAVLRLVSEQFGNILVDLLVRAPWKEELSLILQLPLPLLLFLMLVMIYDLNLLVYPL